MIRLIGYAVLWPLWVLAYLMNVGVHHADTVLFPVVLEESRTVPNVQGIVRG